MAFDGQALVAHVGVQSRLIAVDADEVVVAGAGGILFEGVSRGSGLGGRTIRRAQPTLRDEAGADFGFLRCRRGVMPCHLSTGWNDVSLAWSREPSWCPTTDPFPTAPPNATRGSGPRVKSIYGLRPGEVGSRPTKRRMKQAA